VRGPRQPVRLRTYALAFSVIAAFLILSHTVLLDLPFYWDEVGQFVPAALDIFRAGAWIPVSTIPNVHPPGVMAYLAVVWSVFGYSIVAARLAMLLIAAFAALVTFLLGIELGRGASGAPAFTALALLCLSPLFFAQSMLAQLDMPLMAFAALALLLFLQDRFRASAIACAVLVLIKETGVVVPALFAAWLVMERCFSSRTTDLRPVRDYRNAAWFLLPFPPLLVWLLALHQSTGHWFGNAQFADYNVRDALNPAHILVGLARRFYYVFLSTGHFIGTLALLWALRRLPLLRDRAWRVAWSFVFIQLLTVSAFGGAVLERYLLPALPVVCVAFAISLRTLPSPTRHIVLGALIACLIAANFVNPPYPFPYENNLAFTDFVRLEQSAIEEAAHDGFAYPGGGLIAAAFPVSNALRNPDFGYLHASRHVLQVTAFTRPEVARLAAQAPDIVVVPPRPWDPLHLLDHPAIARFLTRVYGYEPELTADQIADRLSMRVTHRFTRRGLSMALLER
jgi:4-amino-4-deoxy-L-arabinose transferase-like glycosyltransferase